MLPNHVMRSNKLVESDIHFCYSQSLKEIGIYARSHTVTPTILLEKPNLTNEDFVGEKKVDILIVDGNQFYSNNLNGLKMSLEQTKKLGTKVLVDLPDCYASKDGLQQIEFWDD
jgi:metallophosphoesterase superfamily enzyme